MLNKLELYIGPCMLENEQLALKIADFLVTQLKPWEKELDIFFKGSFDKANRTSIDSYRGPGIDEGLKILEKVKMRTGLKVITDFHTPEQAITVAKVVDVLQVPAFLCRQTDMILEGAKACKQFDRILKVKKGQFISPEQTENIVSKAINFLPKSKIRLTERGSCFGYNNLIVDMASFQIMKNFGVKAIYDATHSVQMPGALGKTTGGKREQIIVLAKAALAAGADGIFMETHPEPEKALSDASTALHLEKIPRIINNLIHIYRAANQNE